MTSGAADPQRAASRWRAARSWLMPWLTVGLITLCALHMAAMAAGYPVRPINMIVPFPPGGSTTIIARIVADRLGQALGQQIIVDNRGGAGGTIATRAGARAEPDGYTLLLGYTGTLAINPTLYENPGYDPRKDFAPIGRIATSPLLVLVKPDLPVHSIEQLIALAKQQPGRIDYASAGNGTVGHVAAELFATMAGIKLTHIPYKGTGAAVTDLLGGHVAMSMSPIAPVVGQVQTGALRALAVTSAARSPLFPEIPTVAESGLPGFEAILRYGLVAPAGTPASIIDRLAAELHAVMTEEEVRTKLAVDGAEPAPSSSAEYAEDIDREATKWSTIVRASGAKVE